jgi:hypothetical protein
VLSLIVEKNQNFIIMARIVTMKLIVMMVVAAAAAAAAAVVRIISMLIWRIKLTITWNRLMTYTEDNNS